MQNVSLLTIALVATIGGTGCFGFERRSTPNAPTLVTLEVLLGSWSSSGILPSPTACSDFQWTVTEQTPTSASGSFSARCPGGLVVTGTAQGTLSGDTIAWSASGIATAPDVPECPITLTGTARLEGSQIRVTYTGTTCLGPVSGEEVLTRH